MRTIHLLFVLLLLVLGACKKKGSDTPAPQQPPFVASFSPQSGETGVEVTLTGSNFSATATDNVVQFNGIAATVKSATTTSIVVSVPQGATTGKISVQVGSLSVNSTSNFTVLKWVQKANFGGDGRITSASFVIGNKAYVGTGAIGNNTTDYRKDFWEYDPATNIWTQKADFGGTTRIGAVGFAIGNKGYMGTGREGGATYKKDFWEYDPATNTWTQKADFGGDARAFAVSFNVNNKGYIGTGFDGVRKKDFWEYDPATNVWTQKADFGGTAKNDAVGFGIGNKGYIGTGSDGSPKKDFWEYDPATNIWTQKADFGGDARFGAVSFVLDNKGYVGMGAVSGGTKDFWEYNPATNVWTQKADFGGDIRTQGFGFTVNGKGYVGSGSNGGGFLKDFWVYVP